MQKITGAFGKTGIAARHIFKIYVIGAVFYLTCYIAHAAAKFYGIGSHYRFFILSGVGEFDYGLNTVAFFERKMAEVNPCSATHFLIYGETVVSVGGFHNIFGSCGAVGERYIAYINGILAVRWY